MEKNPLAFREPGRVKAGCSDLLKMFLRDSHVVRKAVKSDSSDTIFKAQYRKLA